MIIFLSTLRDIFTCFKQKPTIFFFDDKVILIVK